MPAKIRIARFFIGLAVVVAVLAPAFAALPAWLHAWGATEAELARRPWQLPLALGVLAMLALLVFTFVQPAIWMRLLVDLVLVGGSAWVATRRSSGNA